jgi:hypothetical protein
VLYGAAQVEAAEEVPDRDPQKRLYARYVEYALGRKPAVEGESGTPRAVLLRQLGWLAKEMRRARQSDFIPGDFDSYWLQLKLNYLLVSLKVFMVTGLIGGILGGLRFGVAVGAASFINFLIWPIVVKLVLSRYGILTETKTGHLMLSGIGALLDISTVGIAGMVFLQASAERPVGFRLGEVALIFSVGSRVAFEVLSAVFLTQRLTFQTVRSTSYFLIQTISNILGLLVQIAVASQSSSPALRQFAIPYGVTNVIQGIVETKLMPIAIHVGLWLRGVAPFRYPDLLNEATRRLFLIRSGRSYSFFHITFRDYMADSYDRHS